MNPRKSARALPEAPVAPKKSALLALKYKVVRADQYLKEALAYLPGDRYDIAVAILHTKNKVVGTFTRSGEVRYICEA